MILSNNPIPELMARYRVLKAQADGLKSDMDDVRGQIEPLVDALDGQKWTDKDGYARLVEFAASVSFDSKAADKLASTWAQSGDAVMQSCGQMLLALRRENPGRRTLQLK